jgi:hypothetical protein
MPRLRALIFHTQIDMNLFGDDHVQFSQRAQAVLKDAVLSYSPGPIRSNEGYPEISIMPVGNYDKCVMMEGDDGWGYRLRKPPTLNQVPCWDWEAHAKFWGLDDAGLQANN